MPSPDDRSLIPQRPTRTKAVISSVDWFFEPCWRGDRLMVRVVGDRISVTNDHGEPVDGAFRELIEVVEPALRTGDALIDGLWTNMPFVGAGSAARHLAEAIAEEGLGDEVPDPIANEQRHAFVAVDLVELDGQALHDVPYQERRRLLNAVIEESVRVRISPAVRHPIHNWLYAWRANGFAEYVAKHMNSRYAPGETAEDWLQLSTAESRGPNPVGRLFMPGRKAPVPKIADRHASDDDASGRDAAGGEERS